MAAAAFVSLQLDGLTNFWPSPGERRLQAAKASVWVPMAIGILVLNALSVLRFFALNIQSKPLARFLQRRWICSILITSASLVRVEFLMIFCIFVPGLVLGVCTTNLEEHSNTNGADAQGHHGVHEHEHDGAFRTRCSGCGLLRRLFALPAHAMSWIRKKASANATAASGSVSSNITFSVFYQDAVLATTSGDSS